MYLHGVIFFGDNLFGVTLFGVTLIGGSLTVNQQYPFPVFNWFCELFNGTCDILAITELLLFPLRSTAAQFIKE
jgi:hypothetical protein